MELNSEIQLKNIAIRVYRRQKKSREASETLKKIKPQDDIEIDVSEDTNESDELDAEVDKTIKALTIKNISRGNYAYWKSIGFKIVDEVIRIVLIAMSITVGVLGVSSTENNEVTAILGFVVAGLIELREKFNLGPRSIVFRNCYHLFEQANSKLLKLKYSGSPPLEILDKIYDIELTLNKIDMSSFNSDVVDINSYTIFNKKTLVNSDEIEEKETKD